MVGIIIGAAFALVAAAILFMYGCAVLSGRESDKERERDREELNKDAGGHGNESTSIHSEGDRQGKQ